MQNELKFNSLLELKTRLKPALNSKYLELKRKHIDYITTEDIWEYLRNTKWLNTNNLSLAAMVDDILNTNSDYFRDYVLKRIENNNSVSELPKTKDKYNELL